MVFTEPIFIFLYMGERDAASDMGAVSDRYLSAYGYLASDENAAAYFAAVPDGGLRRDHGKFADLHKWSAGRGGIGWVCLQFHEEDGIASGCSFPHPATT